MRKLLTIGALFFALMGLNVPANADGFSTFLTPKRCLNNGTITTCFQVGWHRQADGSGVTVQDEWTDTTNGCSDLNTPKYTRTEPTFYSHPDHAFRDWGNWGDEPCDIHHDFQWVGDDTGPMDFRLTTHVNRSMGPDYVIVYRVTLYPNGDSTLESLRDEAP